MATPETSDEGGKRGRKNVVPPPVVVAPKEEKDAEPGDEQRLDDGIDSDEVIHKEMDKDEEAPPEKRTRKEVKAEILAKVSKPTTEPAPLVAVARREDQDLADWLGGMGGLGAMQIRVIRVAPRTFSNKNVKGYLETVDDMVTESQIREQWGGGTYQLRVLRRDKRGSWVYHASTQIEVAGDPRIDNLPKADPNAEASGASAAAASSAGNDKLFGILERQIEHNREPRNTGPDMGAISAFMKPLELQIRTLSDALAKKDEQLEKLASKPANPFQDQLLGKLIEDDSARVNAVRVSLEAEMRTVKENHTAEVNRMVDRVEREKEALCRQYERQLSDQKSAFERELQNMKASFEREISAKDMMFSHVKLADTNSAAAQKAQLESDNRRLERDIVELRTEVKELRAKKDKGPIEMAKELSDFKEALGIDEDGGGEKSALERVADTVMNSDKLFEFAGKWMGPKDGKPAQQAAQPQQQQMQHRPRFIRKNGQVYALGADGNYHAVRRRRGNDGTETEEFEEGLQIPPEQVEFAKTVLERAFANGKAPEVVAATISTALPPEIFQAIRDHGVDGFLNKVAKLEATSPLRRQDGINWLRKLGKALLGEAPDVGPSNAAEDDVNLDDELDL